LFIYTSALGSSPLKEKEILAGSLLELFAILASFATSAGVSGIKLNDTQNLLSLNVIFILWLCF